MRLKRKILLAIAVLLGLLVLWPVMSRHKVERAVDDYRAQLIARGEKLDWKKLAPHFSADQQSMARDLVAAFAMVPSISYSNMPSTGIKLLSPGHALVNWSQQILPNEDCSNVWQPLHEIVERNTNATQSLRAILGEPMGGLSLNYSQGAMLLLPHLAQHKRAAIWLCAAAQNELHQHHVDQACEDLQTCMALSHFGNHEPIMISQLVRVAVLNIALGTSWQVLQCPDVNEHQLADLQRSWEVAEPYSCFATCLEMERAMMLHDFEALRSGQMNLYAWTGTGAGASGGSRDFMQELVNDPGQKASEAAQAFKFWVWKWRWSYDEELLMMQDLQAGIEVARKMQSNAPPVATLKEYDIASDRIHSSHTNMTIGTLWFGIENGFAHNFLRKVFLMEAQRKLVITAIAIKRFQLAHQKLPDDLKQLVPSQLASIPIDPMDGLPLRYHLNADGTFVLYSVGENGTDEGGDPAMPKSLPAKKTPIWTDGADLVWPMPASTQESETFVKKELDAWRKKVARAESIRKATSHSQPAAAVKTK